MLDLHCELFSLQTVHLQLPLQSFLCQLDNSDALFLLGSVLVSFIFLKNFLREAEAPLPKAMFQTFIFQQCCIWASLVAHLVKNPPAMQETWV